MAIVMDRIMYCAIFAAVLTCASGIAYPPTGQTLGQPWPMPQSFVQTQDAFSLSEYNFIFNVVGQSCDILDAAVDRYYKLIFYPPLVGRKPDHTLRFKQRSQDLGASLTQVDVNLQQACEKYPALKMDEAYNLTIDASGGKLTSNSIWGILRGFETFSQIVYESYNGNLQVNATTIQDFPRFSHRGIMLDTSRHFIRKEAIMQNFDAMAYNKINVFHWHIVDDQSFPYQSRDYPNLSLKGAFEPITHIYTQQDIEEIIEYGRLRGIRVIPEFDSPGHSNAWGPGQPGLLAPCYTGPNPDGGFGPIDPTVNTTFDFLRGLMKELSEVFPDKYIHLGGDEVNYGCWVHNPNVLAFMQKMQMGTDFSKLEQYYMQNLLSIVDSYNSGYIIWQDVFDSGIMIRPDTVVEVWQGGYQDELPKVTAKGYNALLSAPWYLDHISYGQDWRGYYTVEPLNFTAPVSQKALVMGGEACLWGEYVDGTNVVSRLWPRASAVAERLWSAESVNNVDQATARFVENRCRMVKRGINAEPAMVPSYCQYEFAPILFP